MALEAASGARPAVTTQKHSRGLGKAGLRFGSWGFASRRQLAPPRRSPALGGPGRRGEHGPGAVRSFQRARPGRGGGEHNSKPTLCFQPAPFQSCQPPGGPSLHTQRGPAPPLTWPRSGGNSNHLSGTHTQQPAAVPSATPLGRALAPPRFRPQRGLLGLLLVPRPFESSPALPIGRAPWRVRPARS